MFAEPVGNSLILLTFNNQNFIKDKAGDTSKVSTRFDDIIACIKKPQDTTLKPSSSLYHSRQVAFWLVKAQNSSATFKLYKNRTTDIFLSDFLSQNMSVRFTTDNSSVQMKWQENLVFQTKSNLHNHTYLPNYNYK